jgi:signal transduction histidine kinase
MPRRDVQKAQRRASGHATLDGVATPSDPGAAAAGSRRRYLHRLDPARLDLSGLRPSSWRDLALCAAVCAIWAAEIVMAPDKHVTPGRIAGVVIGTVPFVSLAWRPRLGQNLLVIAGLCWLAATALQISAPDDTVVMIAIYTVATQENWRRIVESCLFAIGLVVTTAIVGASWHDEAEAAGSLLAWVATLIVLVAVGRWIARRRTLIQSLVDRTRNLEREREILAAERDEMARRAVAVERARLARELHDVVAHHVSVMVIQAGAAEATLPPDATAAAQSLEAIRGTGREALAEMRRMLGLLRSEEPAGTEPESDAFRAPQPGLADLGVLCDRTREAGVDVSTRIDGAARRLPAAVDLSIYRVVQEALTNTLRHGGPGARARILLTYEAASVTVEIADDGRGTPAVGSMEHGRQGVGHGLVGMRERVGLFGGQLEAGPLPAGGYRVMARFPIDVGEADDRVKADATGPATTDTSSVKGGAV